MPKAVTMAPSSAHQRQWVLTLFIATFIATASSFALQPCQTLTLFECNRIQQQSKARSISISPRLQSRLKLLATNKASNDNKSSSQKDNRKTKNEKGMNPYKILGANPNMSKIEIKKLYVNLAKETHPDSAGTSPESVDRFNEVARAWSILSDPKSRRKYDREVAADAIKDEIVDYVSEAAKEYGPGARRFYDEFAIPLLRRTAATTLAGFRAVTEEVTAVGHDKVGGSETSSSLEKEKEAVKEKYMEAGKNTGLADFGRAFQKAIEAGQNATRQIDGEELQIKSVELRKRADEARVESLEALERLAAVKSERLRLTFHTSSANFTSAEALQFLDGFNTSDEVTLMGRMIFKNTITHDIEAFSHAEAEFEEKMKEKKEMDQEVKKKGKDLEKAVNSLRDAEQAEIRARKMLEDALKQVANSQATLTEAQRAVSNINAIAKRTDQDVERAHSVMKRRRDAVRRSLKRKEDKEGAPTPPAKRMVPGPYDSTASARRFPPPPTSNAKSTMADLGFDKQNILAIEALRKDEARIEADFLMLVEKASRLVSRSERLRVKSELFIGKQNVIQELSASNDDIREISNDIKNAAKGTNASNNNLTNGSTVDYSVQRGKLQ